jgi:CRISPR-associated protein Cmr3
MMQTWLIEPRDGLAFRDGRPNSGGSESRSLHFPMPQTVAGAVRTRFGTDAEGRFDMAKTVAVKSLNIHGPLLARTLDLGWELLVPAPLDALWEELGAKEGAVKPKRVHHLHPLDKETFSRGGTVIPEGMTPVGLDQSPKGKPPKDVPAFWTWEHLMGWLKEPAKVDAASIDKNGQASLVEEERLSVAIDPATGTYRHGALFGVSSLAFRSSENRLEKVRDLALAFHTDAELTAGLGFLGGKNKLASYSQKGVPRWPETCPFLEALASHEKVRVMLLTPGIFKEGWKPSFLLEERAGIRPTLKAARVDRPETLSGWDYEHQKTKGTRRAVTAGAVYWLDLGGTEEQRKVWLQELWMKPVSDDEQDRRDGFGLAVMGVWA